jgi:hypothetical protein
VTAPDERAELAARFLAEARTRSVDQLAPTLLMRECAELRRLLGQVLAVLAERQDEARQLAECVKAVEAQTPQARRLQYEADVAAADLVASGYADDPPICADRHGPAACARTALTRTSRERRRGRGPARRDRCTVAEALLPHGLGNRDEQPAERQRRPGHAPAGAAGRRGRPALGSLADPQGGPRGRTTRGLILAGCALVVVVAALVTLSHAPPWAWVLLGAAALPLLARAGRPAGKPIVTAATLPAAVQAPTQDVITRALGSLGIAGVDRWIRDGHALVFPSPVREDGPGWRAEVDLPYGCTATMVTERREQLASGLRRPLGAVWPEPVTSEHAGGHRHIAPPASGDITATFRPGRASVTRAGASGTGKRARGSGRSVGPLGVGEHICPGQRHSVMDSG